MRLKRLTLATLCLALPACSLIPKYERPQAPVAMQWPAGTAYLQSKGSEARPNDLSWQQWVSDPALHQLIDLALINNRDLRQTLLNVDAYRALHRIQRSALFPQVDAGSTGNRQRLPDDLSPSGASGIEGRYDVSLGVSYELDMFGRLRSLERAALEQYLAMEEVRRGVQIALIGDVSTAYFTWRSDQAQLDLTRSTLRSYVSSLELIEASASVGTANALDVRQARSLVEKAQVQQALYTRQVAQDLNALQVLLGTQVPGDLPATDGAGEPLQTNLPVGLPADLLQQRPDIRAAEHRLQAANASIGAARAAFFPRISLTGSAGTASSELSGLFEGGSGTWRFVPQINVPIFNAGRLRANLDYAALQKDINIAQYQGTIQQAFREVADGLAARGTYGRQLQAQRQLVDNNREYYQLARQRYDEGVDNYLAVLDAQRELFSARQQLLNDQLRQLTSEVELYKALGGGWQHAFTP